MVLTMTQTTASIHPISDAAKAAAREHEALKALLVGMHEMGFGNDRPINGADAVDAIASLYDAVTRTMLKGTSIEPLVIYSESNDGFWSSVEGDWVPVDGAQHFFSDPGAQAGQYAEDARVVRLSFARADQGRQAA